MDAMALLCNLQADGPATLRRLHGIGCQTLTDLETADADELAQALACDAAFARRFVREGRALAERFGDEGLEPEAPQPPVPAVPATQPARAASSSSTAQLAAQLAARVRQPSGLVLRAGLIDGLDGAWCEALVGQGIRTLESLRDAPGLALARSLGRPLTELVGLQCLARRRLDDGSRAAALLERDDEPQYVIVPARRPTAEPGDVILPGMRRPERDAPERDQHGRDQHERVEQTAAPGRPTTDGRSDAGGPFA